jgi:MEMO1 family protein
MKPMKSEHAGILYPADAEELYEAIASTDFQNELAELPLLHHLPAALVVPHGSYANILPTLRQAYAATTNVHPNLIVLLAPLHRPVLLEDSSYTVFMAETDSWETPLGDLAMEKTLADILTHAFPTEIRKRNAYFLEEASIELQLPFCRHYFPQIPILPILGTWKQESMHTVAVSIIQTILAHAKQTLFIITSNTVQSQNFETDDCTFESCAEHWIQVINDISKTPDWLGLKAELPSDNFKKNTIHYFSATKEWT